MTTVNKRLQSGQARIGMKQTLKSVELGEAIQVYVAQDADPRMLKRIEQLCMQHNVPMTVVDSMNSLGKSCGIGVGAAMAAIVEDK
ncbi:ribosomal L7Ae/L30e/S12e/Gadd45 family protein [Cohnella yongneupensis]|uniref:Ribosomal L7Ae/L30e/S12e/Gadd45 family protein n=1 Tax=Cohnella yongneupensis TaxID=425006 RepID=A0ABW0QV16_9BACL